MKRPQKSRGEYGTGQWFAGGPTSPGWGPSWEGRADLETNPNTCRRNCHPAPHRGLHGSRQREQETWSHNTARVQRLRPRCGESKTEARSGGQLTLGGQPSGVAGRGGETEAGRERLGRAGHHADPMDVPRWKLPPPRRTPEVLVVALAD